MSKLRSYVIILAGLFSACFSLHAQTEESSFENALLDASSLVSEGQYNEALPILDSLAKFHPEDDAVQYYLGLARFAARDAEGTIAALEKAVQLDSTNTWYSETLANAYLACGRPDAAGALFGKLAEINPRKYRNPYTLSLIADGYRIQRNFPKFFEVLTEIAQDDIMDVDTKHSYLTSSLGGFDSRTFISILPQADTLMRSFVEAHPDEIKPRGLHAEIAGYRNDWQTVIDESSAIIALAGDDTTTIVNYLSIIGDSYHQIGNRKMAFKTYEKALKLNPRYCPVLNNYAWYLCTETRKLGKAAKMSKITIEEEPDNPTYLDTYGWILFLQRKYKEAKPLFKHAMIYGGKESATILMHYSLVLRALGDDKLADYYKSLADNKK